MYPGIYAKKYRAIEGFVEMRPRILSFFSTEICCGLGEHSVLRVGGRAVCMQYDAVQHLVPGLNAGILVAASV